MAPSSSLKIINPVRIWLVVTSLMFVILAASSIGVWRLSAAENQHLAADQLDILTRSRLEDLERGHYRSFVDGLGRELGGVSIAVAEGEQNFAVGSHATSEHCAVSDPVINLSNGRAVTVTLCRPFKSPLSAILMLAMVFAFAAGSTLMVLQRFERGAVKSLGALLIDYGFDLDTRVGLTGMLSRLKSMAGDLRAVQARETALARSVAIAETAQMVAHDVKRPFSTLDMALDALSNETDPALVIELAKRLQPEVRRALGSARSMLADITELSGSASLAKTEASVTAIVDQCLTEPIFAIHKEKVQIECDIRHRHLIDGDSAKIQRVFANILANAVEAMSGRGRIWIATRDIGGAAGEVDVAAVEVRIGNDGPPIHQDEVPKIFELFFTKGKREGSGLGLAIAKKIIEGHGGTIHCTSSPKRGTEFILTLPARSELEGRLPSVICGGATLLVVDDDIFYGDMVASGIDRRLASRGITVRKARSYGEAKAILECGIPLAAICDIDLGSGSPSGLVLTKELSSLGVAVILHSNVEASSIKAQVAASGARAFLPKPTSPDLIFAKLSDFLPETPQAMGRA